MAREDVEQVRRDIVPDEKELIAAKLQEWCDGEEIDLVLTTGGTGLGPRDVTPEATRSILDIEASGISEALRFETLKNTPMAMLSRGVSGVRSGCLIVNLPGSPKAIAECLDGVFAAIPYCVDLIGGPRLETDGERIAAFRPKEK